MGCAALLCAEGSLRGGGRLGTKTERDRNKKANGRRTRTDTLVGGFGVGVGWRDGGGR